MTTEITAHMWQLETLDGKACTERATLQFQEDGAVGGEAACNRFFATQKANFPAVLLSPIGATRMACPGLADEQRYLDALSEMTRAETIGDKLMLSNDAGREMIFTPAQSGE